MIYEEMITDYEQGVIVYTFNIHTQQCWITHISHQKGSTHTFTNPIDELKEELMDMYESLIDIKINSDDKHHFVISYDYETNKYTKFEFRPSKLPTGNTDVSEFQVVEIRHIITSKPATYLLTEMN
jgi:hypothetical protein